MPISLVIKDLLVDPPDDMASLRNRLDATSDRVIILEREDRALDLADGATPFLIRRTLGAGTERSASTLRPSSNSDRPAAVPADAALELVHR